MAQDRFWQMEFYRRLGQGRLSEIFGRDLVETDRYFRMISAAGVTTEIPEEVVFMLDSFAEGVNAYLETHQDRLPIEFKFLRYRPEPWKRDDYLSILKVLNWVLSSGWRVDLTAARMLRKVGEERFRAAFPVWPDDGPLIIPEEVKSLSGLSNPTTETIRLVERFMDLPTPAASNNWVVSGTKSVTGKPILANDTHLSLTNPSFWWEVHLVCPTINASGVAVLAMPVISSGHNRHAAWGVTNVMVDDVDFFMEKVNPDNIRQYWVGHHWENMKVIEETIRVKGEEPIKTEILLTRHGPVVQQVGTGSEGAAISARWAFTEVTQPAKASYLLQKARDINEAREALSHWVAPSQNLVVADTRGNIGYWCSAAIPIRSKGEGMLPVPGWTGEYEWNGYVPFEARPHLVNPKEGFIATANNKVVGKDYPYHITHYWEAVDRITRIRQMLTAKEKLSIEDFKDIQQDVYSVSASEMTPRMLEILERRSIGEEARKARDILSRWDFQMRSDSVGACLFEVTYRTMMENIFKDELGEEQFEEYLQTGIFPPRAMRRLFRKGVSPWFDDVKTPEKETIEDIVVRSLAEAVSELRETLGSDMDKWTWGRVHSLTFEHVLGKKKPLDRIFNLGPFPLGGNPLTVNASWYSYEKPYKANAGVSQRMIVDLSNVDASLRVLPTGESGHVGSPHYKDQVPLYLEGRYHPAWTDREELEKHTEAVLILKPEL